MKKNELKGLVFNIQKFSIHDGVGIRTLVFFKGCPLKCLWCSNPESQSFSQEVMFIRDKCIACGECYDSCRSNCTSKDSFQIDRDKCIGCGDCAAACFANAKKLIGEWMTVDEILQKIEKDRVFYRNSNGGVTVGGGEPLAQIEFVTDLLQACKKAHLHTSIETCGFSPWEKCRTAFEFVDQIHYDIKHMDEEKHRQLTGVGNKLILENARRITEMDKDIIFRIPLVPGCNDEKENIVETGKFISELTALNPKVKTEILLYHSMGVNKYRGLDKDYPLGDLLKADSHIKDSYDELLRSLGCNVI